MRFSKKLGYSGLSSTNSEKMKKKAVDVREIFGPIPTDLSKTFDCIGHDLFVLN